MRQMTPTELHTYLQEATIPPLLIDVREPWEYALCRIADTQLIPMGQVATVSAAFDKEQEIVLICHHGIRSRQVARFLEQRGFSNVINLSGGINAWAREVDPTMQVY